MSSVTGLVLAHAMKKLTAVFMDFLRANQANAEGLTGEVAPKGRRESRSAAKVPKWLAQLSASTPLAVTEILFEQMKKAEKSKDSFRVEAQAALLQVLVEEGLAMDIVSYSTYVTSSVKSSRGGEH